MIYEKRSGHQMSAAVHPVVVVRVVVAAEAVVVAVGAISGVLSWR